MEEAVNSPRTNSCSFANEVTASHSCENEELMSEHFSQWRPHADLKPLSDLIPPDQSCRG
jgi:hypothetical protein